MLDWNRSVSVPQSWLHLPESVAMDSGGVSKTAHNCVYLKEQNTESINPLAENQHINYKPFLRERVSESNLVFMPIRQRDEHKHSKHQIPNTSNLQKEKLNRERALQSTLSTQKAVSPPSRLICYCWCTNVPWTSFYVNTSITDLQKQMPTWTRNCPIQWERTVP